MKALFLFLFIFVSVFSYGQSIFKPLPKNVKTISISKPINIHSRAIGSSDSVIVTIPGKNNTFNAIRFTVVGGYIYSGATSYAAAGFGIALQHIKYDSVNLRNQSQYSVGLYAIGASNLIPKSPSDVGSLAALFGFSKDLFRVGPAFHVIHQNGENPWGVMFVMGGNFNN
jgi:hypothetical protein